jgi:hypothetical protein
MRADEGRQGNFLDGINKIHGIGIQFERKHFLSAFPNHFNPINPIKNGSLHVFMISCFPVEK